MTCSAAVPPAGLAAVESHGDRACAFLVLFYISDSLWLAYSRMIPGAVAIRAVGRVVLILLVPAALGLACLVEFLDRRRWAVASWIVVLVCLAEQGVTTPSLRRGGESGVDRQAREPDRPRRGSRSIIIPTTVGLFISITWTRCGLRWRPECRPSTAIRDTRPVPGMASSIADFDPKADMKAILAEWERTYATAARSSSVDRPGSAIARWPAPKLDTEAPVLRRLRRDASGNMTVRIDSVASRTRGRHVHHPGNDEVDHNEPDSDPVFEPGRRTSGMRTVDRRGFLMSAAAGLTAAAWAVAGRVAQGQQVPIDATPPRRYGPGAEPVRYPDPDVIVLDKRFAKIKIGNSPIRRLHTGMLWAEGPAWNGVGKYLVMSDIPNDVQLRWIEDDGHVSVIRRPAGYSNGNTFDPEGRQISCEHGNRRVVRYEHDGKTTVLADRFGGKPLQRPERRRRPSRRRHLVYRSRLRLAQRIRGEQGPARDQGGRLPDRPQDRPDRQGHRRPLQAQRPLFLTRLQDALHRRHRRFPLPGGPAQYPGVRRRRRRQARPRPRVCLDEDGHAGRVRSPGSPTASASTSRATSMPPPAGSGPAMTACTFLPPTAFASA